MENKVFKYTLLILFLVFLALYYSSNAGIIDYQAKHQNELTQEQIKQFEEDIKNNEKIDLKKYVVNDEKKYSNVVSDTTLKISNTISNTIKKAMDFLLNKMENAMKS